MASKKYTIETQPDGSHHVQIHARGLDVLDDPQVNRGTAFTFAERDQVLIRWERTLRDGARSLGEDTPAGARLKETAEFFAFMQTELLGVLERWRESRTASG